MLSFLYTKQEKKIERKKQIYETIVKNVIGKLAFKTTNNEFKPFIEI